MYHKHQKKSLLNLLVAIPFLLMLIAGATLPSDGNHGILSPKSLSFLLTSGTLGYYLATKRSFQPYSLKAIAFLLGAATFLLAWCMISIGVGKTESGNMIDQLKIFIITVSVVLFTDFIIRERIVTYQTFVKTLIYANFGYSFVKVAMVVFHMTGIIDIFSFMDKTGLRFMSMDMGTGAIRLQTSVDILSPFLLFFVLQSNALQLQLSKKFKGIYFVITAISIVLSFSRVLLFAGFLSVFLFWLSTSYSRIIKSFALFTIGTLLSICIIGVGDVAKMVEKRLFSNENFHSDETRTLQIQALLIEHEQYPLLGKGMGSYTLESVRDDTHLYSYEVQWVGFLMQFGIFGTFLLISTLGIIAAQFLTYPLTRIQFAFLILFSCWVASGFTNPYLISLTSGIVYALFLITGTFLKNSLRQPPVPVIVSKI